MTSTHLVVELHDEIINLHRRDFVENVQEVPWDDVMSPTGGTILMDTPTNEVWAQYQPHNREKTMARLAVVNLMATGCRSGQPSMTEEGEPIPDLTSTVPAHLIKDRKRRALRTVRLLEDREFPWVDDLLMGLHAKHESKPRAARLEVPGSRTLERWFAHTIQGGVYQLADKRGGDQYEDTETGARRRNTENLMDKVLSERTDKLSSSRTNRWLIRQVQKLAEAQGAEGVGLLSVPAMEPLAAAKFLQWGRKPVQIKHKTHDRDRLNRQSRRDPRVGRVAGLDATLGDNLVRMTPDGPPVRPVVHISTEISTGVLTGIQASGFYRDINVGLLMYDAFRPMVILPDPDGIERPRVKGMPHTILATEGVFKPGAIPIRIRSDNIVQNHSRYIGGLANLLGCAVNPSRPGVSTDGAATETRFRGLAQFFEDLAAYVGRHTGERASGVGGDGVLMIDEYNSLLQQFAFFNYNHALSPVPTVARTGCSRLQHWDAQVEKLGVPPFLYDPFIWFNFLPRVTSVLDHRGLCVDNHYFDDRSLRHLPRHLMGPDRVIEFVYDPRRLDCVWVVDPLDRHVYEIPNVLRDITDAPLTKEITKRAFELGRNRPKDGYHASAAFAAMMTALLDDERDYKSSGIQRSLADYRFSWGDYIGIRDSGVTVLSASGNETPQAASALQEGPAAEEPRATGSRPRPAQPVPSAYPAAKPANADVPKRVIDPDRPIKRGA